MTPTPERTPLPDKPAKECPWREPDFLMGAPDGASAGEDARSTPEQRRTIREMCNVLRDDLYDRDGGTESSAFWRSPLKWGVQYGPMADGKSVWARIYRPDGEPFTGSSWGGPGFTTDANADWLDGVLP